MRARNSGPAWSLNEQAVSMKIAIRMDDIAPGMDWEKFDRFRALCTRYNVKPLIGVVPEDANMTLAAAAGKPLLQYAKRGATAYALRRIARQKIRTPIDKAGYLCLHDTFRRRMQAV